MSDASRTFYVRSDKVLSASLGPDEMALLSAAKGTYYGLNDSAKRIWELLEKPITIDGLCDSLTAEFEVDRVTCAMETGEVLAEFVREGLVAMLVRDTD